MGAGGREAQGLRVRQSPPASSFRARRFGILGKSVPFGTGPIGGLAALKLLFTGYAIPGQVP